MSAPPLDRRVIQRGQPVEELVLERGWFRIRRADGPHGVVLEIRIPGCWHEDRPYDDLAGAIAAKHEFYDGYRQAIRDLAG